ncbi:BA14K family protein [Mesorhizobium sp. BAC0120]|uniref:BA14K family protein n=1 Tax=Mesorhizobium sp. BAC0120 TaxID=3090670 RepID=UPI00298C9AC5|nr:BA14K family protein [Mesorhizobium sp. BAC0120]MDW6023096.1 BA14K family protein [Mesorhizobium sp. BAC0120]
MKPLSGLVAASLAASFAAASALPLNAAPLSMPQPATAVTDLTMVQYEQNWKALPPIFGAAPKDIQLQGDIAYYNGYRGYRYKREGYIEHEGWWFPAAAFPDRTTTGSIRRAPLSRAHVDWCMAHFQTYRPADNTYSPPRGPRKECVSPYM